MINIKIPYYFFRLFENDTTSFICQGEISHEVVRKTIRLGEHSVRTTARFSKVKKKVSFLISECLRNVIRHEEKPKIVHQTNNRPSTFMIRNIGDAYYIVTSNLIKNEKTDRLRNKLNKINELDGADAIGKKSVGTGTDGQRPGKENHGLGLVEMTKKSGHHLEYDFEHVNYYLSCFYLQIKLMLGNEVAGNVSLRSAKDVFHTMLDENIILFYKGNFSQESMLPVLGMIESSFKKGSEQDKVRKKVFYFVVELLQNISKHGLEMQDTRQGILVICKKGKGYYIYSGNLIAPTNVEELKDYLEKIKSMDHDQLSGLYKEHLFDGKSRSKGGAGLGLIDLIRYSKDKPVFNFQTHNSKSVFYSFGFSV